MSKLYTLHDAVKEFVKPGDHMAIGGFTTSRKPLAAVNEILRQGTGGFILEGGPAGSDGDLLIGAGRVRAYINCYTANPRFSNVSRRFAAAIKAGSLLFEDYSQDAAMMLFHAASLGLPYIPVKMMLGSGMEREWGISEEHRKEIPGLPDQKYLVQENPFHPGERLLLIQVPKLDLAIIHVQTASPDGTCRILGDPYHDIDIAFAAARTIVTCEELVSDDYIRREPERNSIPGMAVDAVVHLPFGAHPSQVYGCYDYDKRFYLDYDEASKTQEDFDAFLERWVYRVGDHRGYLDALGATRLLDLKAVPGYGYHVADRIIAGEED